MTIIDSHVHLKHGDIHRTEYAPEEIVRTMDGAGIAKSVVFAMSTTTKRSIEMAREAVSKFPGRLIPYVYALPRYDRPVIEELDQAMSEFGFKGIKLHMGECSIADYVADSVLDLAARYDVPCLIDFVGRLRACEMAVERHRRTKIIICHFGRYLSEDENLVDAFISVAEEHQNAFLDASGVVLLNKIEEAVERVGAERTFFGTDGPHCAKDNPRYQVPDTVDFARLAIDRIESLSISRAEKDAILGENIARLLHL